MVVSKEPSQQCKFAFAIFGLNINPKRKKKNLWKLIKSKFIIQENIERALQCARRLTENCEKTFNLTGAQNVTPDELKLIRKSILDYFAGISKINANHSKNHWRKSFDSMKLIGSTVNKLNDAVLKLNQKWLLHYGIINSDKLLIAEDTMTTTAFTQILNECLKYRKKDCEILVVDSMMFKSDKSTT